MIQQISEDLLWSQIVARAWCDEGYKKRLRSDPRNVLAEYGMELPEGMDVKVVEGTEVKVEDAGTGLRFIMPTSPPDELTEEDLIGGPVAWCGWCGACGACGRCACHCACRCF
jgi:hypothetical protein